MSDFHTTNINKNDYSNKAGVETALEFSWDNSVRKILEHV